MKTNYKKMISFLLAALLLMSLAGCGKEASEKNGEAASTPEVQTAESAQSASEGKTTGQEETQADNQKMGKYSYLDRMFISFPEDTFEIDETAILDTIGAKDGSVEIGIVVDYDDAQRESAIQYFEEMAEEEEYKKQDLKIAGSDAQIVTYLDDFGDPSTNILILFPAGSKVPAAHFMITADHSMEDGVDQVVLDILNTIEVVKE